VVENKNIEILEECPWCTSKNNVDWGGVKEVFILLFVKTVS